MARLTEQVHLLLREHVLADGLAIDATMGNGHDTVFLAELVGSGGRVIAFDVQDRARVFTNRLLQERQLRNVEIVLDCHSNLETHVPESATGTVSAVVFNLGYLPGGEKSVTTKPSTTTAAIDAAWRVLRSGGVISVLAYVGHEGGIQESQAVESALDTLPGSEWLRRDVLNRETLSPRVFFVRKRPSA